MSAQPQVLSPAAPDPGMTVSRFENPMGIDGFEFVEFTAPPDGIAQLHDYMRKLGFTAVARHRRRPITVYRQGDCTFLVNEDPDSFAADFAAKHGPSACGFAIRFSKPAEWVRTQVLAKGAEAFPQHEELTKAVAAPVIKGIGGCMLYLVDRYDAEGNIFDPDYEWLPGAEKKPAGFGLTFVDHLTHNLYQGNMEKWAEYYERLFNFREIRYFDIKGAKTGLLSKAMTAPDGMVRIPLNESADPKSQINEFLEAYRGEGIQHIACFTGNIYETVERMREAGIEFLDTPDTYYEVIDQRIPEHGEDVERLRRNRILIDADPETGKRKLLQIFTQNAIGPIFFEIIQRKGNEGFGEGNFRALFESIERDQMRRGVL
ncbi:4-hydroxyphenylpyruvate dioxygenase [Pseudoxanthomonas taiwanensis]|jgi:4-hydroxyphenylpyruvate dioxygenase|uniref:4-hydroxyphenylpyruvate dioxygenase n=1 Tax=Pseudoxanthomonas taiwanensis TaxID=176598 RepID=A0A921NZB2_9GAMM|nr:4-hydroxyphenylpyruvate dioxygenase [Pseudoxanthomonas taiwanensis]KAF1688541.1 4-hydroxyphenylpyruvate dioxygenase [Pseudoxanthomonas taiwanensis]MBO2466974.1 4-hydroxyphenylpyruvate dioxygenase [Xanthomonadaceae bacterium]